MAVINGNAFLIKFSTKFIAGVTSNSIEISADMLDISTKDSGGWATFIAGRKSGTVTLNFLYDTDGADATHYDIDDLWTAFSAGTELTILMGQYGLGEKYFQSKGFINSLSIEGEKDSVVSVSASIQLSDLIELKAAGAP